MEGRTDTNTKRYNFCRRDGGQIIPSPFTGEGRVRGRENQHYMTEVAPIGMK